MPVRSPSPLLVAFLLALAAPPQARASSLPILVDGAFGDWTPAAFVAGDAAGDAGGSGIDFTSLMIANDGTWLFLRFDTGVEVQSDELHHITIALDTDRNAGTGAPVAGTGAELVWNLGQRTGTFHHLGSTYPIGQASIGLVVAPTVSGTQFEVAIRRAAVPAAGAPLFAGPGFTMALYDNAGGDLLAVGLPGYTFDPTPQPVPSLALARGSPSHVRIASFNVENDGLFATGSRAQALDRMFDAIDPDVWVINEAWNSSAAQVAAKVEQFLPSGPGRAWHAVKLDAGNVIVSRFPILQSWLVLAGSRITAALLDPGPAHATDLLVVANHWSCCTADASRQNQADALIAFLRDARTPGGAIDLAAGTPIVAAGDFNLVGWRAQLVTLLTGDIAANGTWGPDSPPDWDGSEFDQALPRHPDARFVYTWHNDNGTFYPGRLDYILHTGSVSQLHHTFVLDTRTMTSANLAAHGLQAMDAEIASDHFPVVADFTLGAGAAGVPGTAPVAGVALAPPMPNPSLGSTIVRFALDRDGPIELAVFDGAGRRIRTLARDARAAGPHAVAWDGRDEAGRTVAPGVYIVRLWSAGGNASRRLVRMR